MQELRKGKAYKVDKEEYVAVSLNIRDRDHFYSIVHYLNRTLGRTGWKAQKNTLKKFLHNNDPSTKPIFVNNFTWLKNLNYIS